MNDDQLVRDWLTTAALSDYDLSLWRDRRFRNFLARGNDLAFVLMSEFSPVGVLEDCSLWPTACGERPLTKACDKMMRAGWAMYFRVAEIHSDFEWEHTG